MKKSLFAVVAFVAALTFTACQNGDKNTVILDLTQPTTTLEFDENGLWKGTYDTEITSIKSQVFEFQHTAAVSEYDGYSYTYYNGFTVSKDASGDITHPEAVAAKAAKSGKADPYMVCYWGDYAYNGIVYRTSDIKFSEECTPQFVLICNTAAVVKSLKEGDNYARPFKDGDYFTLTIKALDAKGNEIKGQEVTYYLADFRDGKSFINSTWEKVDLSALGSCYGMTFSMETTDVVSYDGGTTYYANTPTYFCLDGLTVIMTKFEK